VSEITIWERNINAAPELTFLKQVESSNRIQKNFTRSGEITVTANAPGGAVRNLHSPYDPWREAERLCAALPSYAPIVLVFGVGAAFVPRHIIAKRRETTVVAVERDPGTLRKILETIDLSREIRTRRLHLAVEEDHLQNILQDVLSLAPPGIPPILELTPWVQDDGNTEAFRRIGAVCTAVLREREEDLFTIQRFGVRWLGHTLRNTLVRDLSRARGAENIAAVVAGTNVTITGAGPQVEEAQLGTPLIAVDTMTPALAAHSATPVMVTTIDTQCWSALHFRAPAPGNPVVAMDLAVPAGVHRHVADQQCLWLGSNHPLHQLLQKAGAPLTILPRPTTSVGEAAVALARYFGATISATVGLDGTAPGAKLYARGTWLSQRGHREASRLSPAEHRLTAPVYRDMTPLAGSASEPASFTKPSFRLRAEAIREIASSKPLARWAMYQKPTEKAVASFDPHSFWLSHAAELQEVAQRLRQNGDLSHRPLAAIKEQLGPVGMAQLPTAIALRRREMDVTFVLTLPETFEKISTFLFSVLNRY
jgi:hypothetical protein